METTYVIALWILGILLVAFGWYADANIITLLGALTLAFGALLAFRRT